MAETALEWLMQDQKVNPGAVDTDSLDDEVKVRNDKREGAESLKWLNDGDLDAAYDEPIQADLIVPPKRNGILETAKGVALDIGKGAVETPIKGILGGARDAIQEMNNSADQLGDWLTQNVMDLGSAQVFDKKGNFDPKYFAPGVIGPEETGVTLPGVEQPKSATGKMVRGVSQFVTGFYTGGKLLQAAKLSPFLPSAIRMAAQGAIADATAFSPHQERLSNLIQSVPALQNPITDYLEAKPDDSEAEGRLKNAVEGLGFGGLTSGLIKGVKLYRSMRGTREASLTERAKSSATGIKTDSKSILREARGLDLLGDEASPLVQTVTKKIAKAGKETALPVPTDVGSRAVANAARFDAGGKEVYVNFARFNTSEDIKAVIGQMADAYAPNVDQARRGIQSNVETVKLADSEDAFKILVERRTGQPLNAEQALASRNLWVTASAKLQQVAELASKTPTEENLFQFRRMLAVTHAIQKEVIGARTETARALQSWSIPAGGNTEKFKGVLDALERTGGAEVSQELAKRIVAAGRTDAPMAVMMALTDKSALAKTLDSVHEFWINALLSGPKTHIVNTLSNTSVIGISVLERGIAARLSVLSGREGVETGEALAELHGLRQGLRDAFSNAAKAFRTGQTGWGVNKIEGPRVRAISSGTLDINSDSWLGQGVDVLGAAVNVPGRALQAEDEFFKSIGYRMSLHGLAHRTVAREVRAGKIANDKDAIKSRMADIIMNPPESLRMEAGSEAAYRTFTSDPGAWTKKLLGLRSTVPGARWVLPFVSTPSNILKYSFERTPLAPVSASYRAAIAKGGADAAIARARMGLGTMAMLTASDMASDGLITGSGPPPGPERDNWLRQGNQPYSFKVGNKWIAYNRLDPTGFLFGISADMTEFTKNADFDDDTWAEMEELAAASVFSVAENLQNKSYLQGFAMLTEALTEPDRFAPRYAESLISSFVPASAFEASRQIDPTVRVSYDILSSIQRKTPGWSSDLPPRRDLWGRTQSYESGFGKAYDVLSPMYGSTADPQPIDQEMQKAGYFVGMPQRGISIGDDFVSFKNKPELYSDFLALQGNTKPSAFKTEAGETLSERYGDRTLLETLNDMVTGADEELSEGYREQKPDDRENFVKKIVKHYRDAAKAELMANNPWVADKARILKAKREGSIQEEE